MDVADVDRWRFASVVAVAALGGSEPALHRVISDARWVLSDQRAPTDCWCGEVVMRPGGVPIVILYEDGPWTRLPERTFELAAQTGVDHMVGHLYPYFSGADDYGEEVACRYQFLLPRKREGLASRLTPPLVALLHRFHKKIPLRNYSPLYVEKLGLSP